MLNECIQNTLEIWGFIYILPNSLMFQTSAFPLACVEEECCKNRHLTAHVTAQF